ncbi:hypothetical protein B484DRAFT_445192 [Ochromonadaceae sp. CCMP2298]|nr:hypothetical protein B484DRAFT_445192 [Ochromonadaceae sp. CCMP2298]
MMTKNFESPVPNSKSKGAFLHSVKLKSDILAMRERQSPVPAMRTLKLIMRRWSLVAFCLVVTAVVCGYGAFRLTFEFETRLETAQYNSIARQLQTTIQVCYPAILLSCYPAILLSCYQTSLSSLLIPLHRALPFNLLISTTPPSPSTSSPYPHPHTHTHTHTHTSYRTTCTARCWR